MNGLRETTNTLEHNLCVCVWGGHALGENVGGSNQLSAYLLPSVYCYWFKVTIQTATHQ